MNLLQEKVFELLREFVRICDKWSIPYYLVCGSALGAEKYGGFIPWDDDIDVALLREDYQRFLEVAPGELPQGYFLQNYMTEPCFPHLSSKLRNSNTAFIETGVAGLPMNHGIYLDIFPLDGQPAAPLERKLFFWKKKVYDWIRFCSLEEETRYKRWRRKTLPRFLGLDKKTAFAVGALSRLCAKYSTDESELWCNYGNWQGELEYAPKWHYGDGTWATFEGLRVRIPENIDAYLTQKYGDWRADPPVEKQKSHHRSVVIDTEKSYKEYL